MKQNYTGVNNSGLCVCETIGGKTTNEKENEFIMSVYLYLP